MNALRLAWLDLTRRPLSTVIACVSIALSVATAGVLLRLSHLAERRYSTLMTTTEALVGAKSGDLDILLGALNGEVSRTDQTGYLPMKLFESLRAQAPVHFEDGANTTSTYVRSVTPFVYAGFFRGFAAVGTDDSILRRGLRPAEGSWPAALAEIAIGARLASDFDLKLGDTVTVDPLQPARPGEGPEATGQGPLPFKVSAILEPTNTAWDSQAWMTLASARVLLTHTRLKNSIWGPDVLNYFLIDLEPRAFVKLKALVNDRTVGQAVDVATARSKLKDLTGTGRALGLTIVGLVLLMAVLSLASVLVTRFESLSLQIAVLRAIGYSRGEMAQWLLLEGLLLGLVSCLVGALIDALVFPSVRAALAASLPAAGPSSVFESSLIWIAALIASVLSVMIPIARAYRLDVHSALRG